jgi:hypothetical protein
MSGGFDEANEKRVFACSQRKHATAQPGRTLNPVDFERPPTNRSHGDPPECRSDAHHQFGRLNRRCGEVVGTGVDEPIGLLRVRAKSDDGSPVAFEAKPLTEGDATSELARDADHDDFERRRVEPRQVAFVLNGDPKASRLERPRQERGVDVFMLDQEYRHGQAP